eukprot:c28013_g1_i2 orf=269-1945(+)
MLPEAPFGITEDRNFFPFSASEFLEHASKSIAMEDERWIYLPPEGGLKIERHGRSATVHICSSSVGRFVKTEPLSHSKAQESVSPGTESRGESLAMDRGFKEPFSRDCKVERETDAHTPGFKRSRIIPSLTSQVVLPLSAAVSSSDLTESGELQDAVKSAGQMHPLLLPVQPASFSLLDRPSPLGLTLRKTPSLVDLIQLKLAHGDLALSKTSAVQESEIANKGRKGSMQLNGQHDKIKASNFPAEILKIGTWECISRYEGDLVVKCYYAKKKLVWEVLENGLKSKIEIQWSDITALKASCPDIEPGVLEIEVSCPPLFFKEINPQPRKHTLWQTTSDFTGGQATNCRWHYLKFSPGLLSRQYEKLIQCDPRLKSLSEKVVMSRESDYFQHWSKIADGQHEQQQFPFPYHVEHPVMQFDSELLPSFSSTQTVLGSAEMKCSGIKPKLEPVEPVDRTECPLGSSPSASSAIDLQGQDDGSYFSSQEGFYHLEAMAGTSEFDHRRYTSAIDDLLVRQLSSDTLFSESASVQRLSCIASLPVGDAILNVKMLDEPLLMHRI